MLGHEEARKVAKIQRALLLGALLPFQFFVPFRAFLWLSLIGACGLAATAREHAVASDPDPTRFESEIAAFEKWDRQNSVPRDAVLFVGSSSIRMWETAKSFPDLPVINRGFGGSHISDVNHFMDRIVFKYKPRMIVFYAGDNDIAAGKSPQQVFADFEAFLKSVQEHLPKANVVYLPIKPSIARWTLWPQMKEANALVAQRADSDGQLICVDMATPMLGGNGEPRPELFLNDGLHINEKGYQVWNDILRPVLQKESSAR